MEKTARFWVLATVILSVPVLAHAQLGGCVDSPENPTAVLVLVGTAAAVWPTIRQKMRRNRKK